MSYRQTWLGAPVNERTRSTGGYVAVAVLSCGSVVHFSKLDWWAVAAVALVCVLCAVAATAGQRYADQTRLAVLGWVLADGIWLTLACADVVWVDGNWRFSILAWFLVGVASTLLWPIVRLDQVGHEQRFAKVQEDLGHDEYMTERRLWEGIFTAMRRPGVKLVKPVRARNGRSVRMRLPADGSVTFGTVRQLIGNIEIALSSAGIKASPGSVTMEKWKEPDGSQSSTDFIIHVNEFVRQTAALPVPDGHDPRTIVDPVPVGVYRDGPLKGLHMVGRHIQIIGQTGDGKSNFLTVLVKGSTQCDNAVVWMVDFKGGATARRLLDPHLKQAISPLTGQPVGPVLDWVAVEPFEALRMVRALLDIMEDRPFRRSKGNKHRPTREHPQIVLMIEESSLVFGRNALLATARLFSEYVTKITTIGRSEGGTVVEVVQRNTVTMSGPGDKTANLKTRVGFSAESQQDARMIFPKSANLAELVTMANTPGSCLIAEGTKDDREMPVDTYFIGDDDAYDGFCYEVGLWHGDITPGLTEGTHEWEIACRYGYSDRWTDLRRMGWVHGNHVGIWQGRPVDAVPVAAVDASGPLPVTERLARMNDGTLTHADVAQVVGDDFQVKTALMTRPLAVADEDARGIQAMYITIAGLGENGCTSRELIDAMITQGHLTAANQKKVFRWLGEAKLVGKVIQPLGKGGRYYLP